MRFALSPLLIAVAGALCSCGDKGDSTQLEPVEIKTQSGVTMIYLAGGSFTMGADKGSPDERPAHKITLSPFLIDKTEVTHAMFRDAQLPNPSHWQDDPNKPVESLRWSDAKRYCNERSIVEGLDPCYDAEKPGLPCSFEANGYRLPTEAEWEFAARAGTQGDYDFGAASKLKHFAIFEENGQKRTHPVGSRKPNRWGIHDMYGNVAEWCQDAYDANYYVSSPTQDPTGPDVGNDDALRVIRGGSWKASSTMCRVSFRQGRQTGDVDACFTADYCGFRCVRRLTSAELAELK